MRKETLGQEMEGLHQEREDIFVGRQRKKMGRTVCGYGGAGDAKSYGVGVSTIVAMATELVG